MSNRPAFECSPELRVQFNRYFEIWRKKHFAGLDELARRCGVSPSYLSHIGRYGRIPGRPILILLALNFELDDAQTLFEAARVKDDWPYERGARIGKADQDSGFLSVKLDMQGFTDAIRSIVHAEAKPRNIQDLLRGKPLRMGLNSYLDVLLEDSSANGKGGFFPNFCDLLGMTLRCKIETVEVSYAEYPEKLRNHEIDVYGPKNVRPGTSPGFVSAPFCRMGMAALVRKRNAPQLAKLPAPLTQADLLKHDYSIAVLKNSRSHLYANVALRRSDADLVLCDSVDEAVERTTLSGIARPVHLTVCNAPMAISKKRLHPKELDLAFADKDSVLEFSDSCIAVRNDWPELVTMINQSIDYLVHTGTLQNHFGRWLPTELSDVIQIPQHP
ncbi:MAG: transporter substrate-binding domain-containing protein [Bdellovibrionota bacterium]